MDDKELELCTNLLLKVKDALGHAVERIWPSFYADLLNGGWENSLTIKLAVEKHNSSSGATKVQSIGWLPKPKVVDKDFPIFDVDGSQLTIEFDKPSGTVPPASADGEPSPVPAALVEGELPPSIMYQLASWIDAAKLLGCPLYIPCMHEGVPCQDHRYDRIEGGKCTSCAPLPNGDEFDRTIAAMENDGLVVEPPNNGFLSMSATSVTKLREHHIDVPFVMLVV